MTLRPLNISLALLMSMSIGCGGTDPDPPLDLTGRWQGPDGHGGTFGVALSHDLPTDSLSGTWTSTGQGMPVSGTLGGTLATSTRSVSMSMYFEEAVVFTYTATVEDDGNTITGTVRDTDGETNPLNLTRT